MEPTIEQRIEQWIVANILLSGGEFPISDTESFLDTGLIDSLGVMELVSYVRTEFSIAVAPLDVTPENFDSVAALAAYIRRKAATEVAAAA